MNNLLIYGLEVMGYMAIFLTGYYLWIRKAPNPEWNRIYLLFTLLASILLPFLPALWMTSTTDLLPVVQLPTLIVGGAGFVNPAQETATQNGLLPYLPYLVLYVGGGIAFLQWISGMVYIYHLRQVGQVNDHIHPKLIVTGQKHAPFSFMNWIYISDVRSYDSKALKTIMDHELTHIHKWHSIDNLIVEGLRLLFWWNPLLYIYRRMLNEAHEFEADQGVLHHTDIKSYGHFLIQQLEVQPSTALVHSIFSHPLKTRIIMMKQLSAKSTTNWRYASILPLLFLGLFFHSCANDTTASQEDVEETVQEETNDNTYTLTQTDTIVTFDPETKTEDMKVVSREMEVYKMVDRMPRYPGCEEGEENDEAKKACANKKMLEFVYGNIKYPKAAKDNEVEGTVVSRFVVSDQGIVSNIEILKDPGAGCGDEVKRVLNEMSNSTQWVPGAQNGKAVNVAFTLPVKFKLQ
jgi:TonB family protein